MFFGNVKKALFLSAHPDDTEFGAGGLIQILIEKGIDVHLAVLSNPVEALPVGSDKMRLINEQSASTEIIGLKNRVTFFDFPVRRFVTYRQEILEELIKLRSQIEPDLIITSSENDFHQDHNVLAAEAVRAFKQATLLGYTHPWNTRKVVGNVFFEISETQLNKKIEAISAFESQSQRSYSQPRVIESLAIEAGIASGFRYAERFELVSMSVNNDQ